MLLRTVTKESKLKIDTLRYRLTILRPSNTVSLYRITISVPYYVQGVGWGVATERGGGVVLRSKCKPDTNGQPYLTISYTNQGFQHNIRRHTDFGSVWLVTLNIGLYSR
jgi:hypothetical protein